MSSANAEALVQSAIAALLEYSGKGFSELPDDERLPRLERIYAAVRDLLWYLSDRGAVSLSPRSAELVRGLLAQVDLWKYYGEIRELLLASGRGACVWERSPISDSYIDGLFNPENPGELERVDQRLQYCSVLVASHALSPRLAKRMQTVRRCFALGLYDAALVYCRTLTEMAVKEYLTRARRHLLVEQIRRETLVDWLRAAEVERVLGTALQKDALVLKDKVNDLVHWSGRIEDVTEDECLAAIRTTVTLVEKLSVAVSALPPPPPRPPASSSWASGRRNLRPIKPSGP